jgi:murein DD-endopeptidase MepM/ murein hydrolase activator NlpD
MRTLIAIVVVLGVVTGVYVAVGQASGPVIQIVNPERFVGTATMLDVAVEAPAGLVSERIDFVQNGVTKTIWGFDAQTKTSGAPDFKSNVDASGRTHTTMTMGPATIPGLKSGAARLVVTASRAVLFGLRTVESTLARDVTVRLEKPTVSVLSTKHYINLGGSEMIVYRAAPEGIASGVQVGDVEYPGFPASGITVDGMKVTDPAVHVAFFALLYDQDVNAPMRLFARDEAGNVATTVFDHKTFPKKFKSSKIDLSDALLDRVVPAILAGTIEIKPEGSTIEKFLAINGELRRKNAATIASMASKTATDMLWGGVPFHPFTNNKVEAAFADFRTYFYQGKEVDKQVHLGFDLASFANRPVLAGNRGRVLYADNLGIYGNCVIIDHGLGVQSLYAHLSSIDVKPGTMVEKEQVLGKSGMTGIAGGDHLHFTMLVGGHMVNPIEWWDPHWIQDRVTRKLHDAR